MQETVQFEGPFLLLNLGIGRECDQSKKHLGPLLPLNVAQNPHKLLGKPTALVIDLYKLVPSKYLAPVTYPFKYMRQNTGNSSHQKTWLICCGIVYLLCYSITPHHTYHSFVVLYLNGWTILGLVWWVQVNNASAGTYININHHNLPTWLKKAFFVIVTLTFTSMSILVLNNLPRSITSNIWVVHMTPPKF